MYHTSASIGLQAAFQYVTLSCCVRRYGNQTFYPNQTGPDVDWPSYQCFNPLGITYWKCAHLDNLWLMILVAPHLCAYVLSISIGFSALDPNLAFTCKPRPSTPSS